MKSFKPESVGDILARLIKKTRLGKQLEEAKIWERWPEIAGPKLHAHGRPQGVKDNVLTLEVDSTVWMNKFAYLKWDLLKKINRMAGRELVSDIYFVLTPDTAPTPPAAKEQ